jgi:FKBP-type peptidyl-prolyl cis-trans isomerase FklB
MSDNQFSTTEEQASYGMGMQMGQQITNAFPGVSTAAAMAGLEDAIFNKTQQVSADDINAAFQIIQDKLRSDEAANAEQHAGEGIAFLEKNAIRDDVIVTETGLQYAVITEGNGEKPNAGSTVRTHYRGTLIDGTEFDSSYSRNQPTEFPVGGVIAGWTEALQLMNVGSKWKLFIPYQLAYGEQGAGGTIGPYQALVFEIELLAII